MVYDSYIGKTGNIFFFSFYYFGHCKAMILMAKGKSGKEKALGTFPVFKKKKSTTADSLECQRKASTLQARRVTLLQVTRTVQSISQAIMMAPTQKPPQDKGPRPIFTPKGDKTRMAAAELNQTKPWLCTTSTGIKMASLQNSIRILSST